MKAERPRRRPEKVPERRVEKKKEPSPEEKLQKLHTDIKFALKVDSPALEELGSVQVTSHILQKNTDVVATLKKIRRYKASREVMQKAAEVYNKLKLQVLGGKAELLQKPKQQVKSEEDMPPDTDSTTPVNGEAEPQKADSESAEPATDNPKSPGTENMDTAEQHQNSQEKADEASTEKNDITAREPAVSMETEPGASES
ncbi:UNVERIFIED_CONTAM: hypothetical protein FKN15_005753 [Acipenser sinensis]